MKLVVAIVHGRDATDVVDALLAEDFRATRLESAGGFLREGSTTLLMGVDDERVEEVFAILAQHCKSRMQEMSLPVPALLGFARVVGEPIRAKVGGAVVFVMNIDRFEQL